MDKLSTKEEHAVFVGNLKKDASKDDLKTKLFELFKDHLGLDLNLQKIKMKGGNMNQKKFAFIYLQSKEDQDKAIEMLETRGSQLKLKFEFSHLVKPDQILKVRVKTHDVDDKAGNKLQNTENMAIERDSVMKSANDDEENKMYTEDEYLGNENENKEFKLGGGKYIKNTLKKDVAKYLCGFLNSEQRGKLYIGVEDTGFVKGIECNHKRENTIRIRIDESVKTFIPTIFPNNYFVEFIPVQSKNGTVKDNCKVLEITVHKVLNLTQLYQADGKFLMRRSGSVVALTPSDIQDWWKQKQNNITEENSIKRNKMADVSSAVKGNIVTVVEDSDLLANLDVSPAVMGNTVLAIEEGKSSDLLANFGELWEEIISLEEKKKRYDHLIESKKLDVKTVLLKVIQSQKEDMIRKDAENNEIIRRLQKEKNRKDKIMRSLQEENNKKDEIMRSLQEENNRNEEENNRYNEIIRRLKEEININQDFMRMLEEGAIQLR